MLRGRVKWACMAVAVFGFVTSPAAAAPSVMARGLVRATVTANVAFAVIDEDHVDVRSNVPWRLSLDTAAGPMEISGPASPSGTRVLLPRGSDSYWLSPAE